MNKDIAEKLIKSLTSTLLVAILFIASCSTDGLNQISVKELKNEITGELDEYRSIKISEDDQNDYFLEVKIPKTHRQVSWNRLSKDNALVNEFISKNSSKGRYVLNFRISEELYQKKSLHHYMMWRKNYINQKYKVYRVSVDYDLLQQVNENLPDAFPESGTIIQEMMCIPRPTIICLPNQKEINIIKAYKGKTIFWTIEFSKVIDGHLSELEKENVVSESELMMKDCCKILTVKKLKEGSPDNKKKMEGK